LSENNRIGIGFEVDSSELQEFTKAISVIDQFNKKQKNLVDSINRVSQSMDGVSSKAKESADQTLNFQKVLGQLGNAIRGQTGDFAKLQQAQKGLSEELRRYGKDVKVTIDDTGKVKASFKDLQNQVINLSGQFDSTSGTLKNVKQSMAAVSNEASRLKQSMNAVSAEQKEMLNDMVKGRQYMESNKKSVDQLADSYNKLHRGTDLSSVLTKNKGSFDVFNDAVRENANIVRASIDRNGKFNQTLRTQDGTLVSIAGYYDKANQRLTQYSQSMSTAATQTKQLTAAQAAMQQRLRQMETAHDRLNKQTLSWGEALEIASVRMIQWTVVATAIFQLRNAFYGVMRTIVEVDTQMTNLRRVMDVSDIAAEAEKTFDNLLTGAIDLASELGQTLDGVLKAMNGFARQGFGEDMVLELTRVTTMMSAVSDMDMEESMSKLTSGMIIFKKEVNSAMQIVDMLNEVDNNFAVTTQDLAQSMARAGGTANAFGISLDKLMGYTTAIGEATRESGNIIGNSIKSFGSRITTLGEAADALNEVGISTTKMVDGVREVRRVDDILDELSGKWDGLTEAQQQNIGVNVAGRYQLSRFLTLMQNYERGMEAAEAATKSNGSAQKEFEKYLESIQAQINLLVGASQKLAWTIGEKGLGAAMVITLKSVTSLILGINELVDKFGAWNLLMPVLLAASVALSLNFKKLITDTALLSAGTVNVNAQLTAMGVRMGMSTGAATAMSGAVGMLAGSLRTLAAATVMNPFFWVTGALVAIPMLIGNMQQAEAEQERMIASAQEADRAYKQLQDRVRKGTVTEYDISGIESQIKAYEELAEVMYETNQYFNNNGKNLADKSNWIDILETMNNGMIEHAATVGIVASEYDSYFQFMDAYDGRMQSLGSTQEAANAKMKEQADSVNENAQSFHELNEEMEKNFDLTQSLLGIADDQISSLKDQANYVAVMGEVNKKSWSDAQVARYNEAINRLSGDLGLTREEIMKHPEAVQKKIKAYEDESKAIDEMLEDSEGYLTASQKQSLAKIVEARNAEESARRKIDAQEEVDAVRKVSETKESQITAKLKRMYEEDANSFVNSSSKKKNSSESSKNKIGQDTNLIKSYLDSTGKKYVSSESTISGANKGISSSTSGTTKIVGGYMFQQRNQLLNTSRSWSGMSSKASSSNSTVSSSAATSSGSTRSSLGRIIDKIKDLKWSWGDLAAVMSSPIHGTVSVAQKIVRKFFGGEGGQTHLTSGGAGGMTSITSGFGMRNDPINGRKGFHNGVDIAGRQGSSIKSRVNGRVVYSGIGRTGTSLQGLGNVVGIQDELGLTHLYGHNSSNLVQEGSFVSAGQTIATMGSTGRSTGTHSHYEVRAGGRAVNPLAMGGSYTVKRGDTFSDIAMKYYGNAYSGGIAALKKLNPGIKNIDRIATGQRITVPGSSSSGSSKSPSKPSKPKYTQEYADKKVKQVNDYVDYMQSMNAEGYLHAGYETWKLRNNRDYFKYASADNRKDYNKKTVDALGEYGNLNSAKSAFDAAGLFDLNSDQKAAVWKGIEKSVLKNIQDTYTDYQNAWVDGFEERYTEANEEVEALLSANQDALNSKLERKKKEYIERYYNSTLKSLDMYEESSPEDKLNQIKDKMDELINENAELEYSLSSNSEENRLKELLDYRKQVEDRLKAVDASMKAKGVKDSSTINSVKEPLNEKLKEITNEYNNLQNAIKNSKSTISDNASEIDRLSKEYSELQEEMKETEKKTAILDKIKEKVSSIFSWDSSKLITEKTDEFGNTVRDVEGTIRSVLDVQKAISEITADIYDNIDNTVEEMISEIIGSQLPDIASMFDEDSDYSGIASGLNSAIDSIKPTWDSTLGYMSQGIADMFSSQNWNGVLSEWTYNMSQSLDGLEPILEALMMKFPESIGNIMDDLPNLVSVAMQNITVGLFNTVIQIMNQLLSTVNQIIPAADRIPSFEKMNYATPTYTQTNENNTNNENKVYKADTNVTRNVTYVVQAGVVVGTQSEMREFAMIIKEMIEEEDGRGDS
jgi:TP901 family phage tail tape measure protein